MSLFSKRLVGIVASTALVSLVSAAAHAQTIDVLTGGTAANDSYVGAVTSTYTFNKSMILNSIGFVRPIEGFQSLSYSINGISKSVTIGDLDAEVAGTGIRWLTLANPTTVNESVVVTVSTLGNVVPGNGPNLTKAKEFTGSNGLSSVTYNGITGTGVASGPILNRSNSNLKVSNPSANVAPEPGSFALALTGGATLIGICIRRRRNAG